MCLRLRRKRFWGEVCLIDLFKDPAKFRHCNVIGEIDIRENDIFVVAPDNDFHFQPTSPWTIENLPHKAFEQL